MSPSISNDYPTMDTIASTLSTPITIVIPPTENEDGEQHITTTKQTTKSKNLEVHTIQNSDLYSQTSDTTTLKNNNFFTKFKNMFKPKEIKQQKHSLGLFNSLAVSICDTVTSVVPKKIGKTVIALYIIFCFILFGLMCYINGFIAVGKTADLGQSLMPTYLNCQSRWEGALNVSTSGIPQLIRCQANCPFYSNSSRVVKPAYTNSQGNMVFKSGSFVCSSAAYANVASYWKTLAVITEVPNSVDSLGESYFEVSKPIESFNDVTIGYFLLLILFVMIVGLTILLIGSSFKHSSSSVVKNPTFVWYMFFVILCYFYIIMFEEVNYNWTYWMATAMATFPPFLAIAFILYLTSVKYTLFPLSHFNKDDNNDIFKFDLPLMMKKKTTDVKRVSFLLDFIIFYMLPCFILLHINVSEWIDLPQITLSTSNNDLNTAGGVIELMVVVLVILIVLSFSFYQAFLTGRLLNYIVGYASVVLILVIWTLIMASAPFNLTFHFHHYALALFLWPLTCFKNRFSVFCQGALLGLFINGAAAWGIASLWV